MRNGRTEKSWEWTWQIITGLSYAFGELGNSVVDTLKSLGIQYARTVNSTGGFSMPTDFMRWNPTCHHNGNIIDKAGAFLNMPGYMRFAVLCLPATASEFAQGE